MRYLFNRYILSENVTCTISLCVRYFIIISMSEISYLIRNWSILGQQLTIFVQKLNNIVKEIMFVGISFDYIFLQRIYVQTCLLFAKTIADNNYYWWKPGINDDTIILRRIFWFYWKSRKWHLMWNWQFKLFFVGFQTNFLLLISGWSYLIGEFLPFYVIDL